MPPAAGCAHHVRQDVFRGIAGTDAGIGKFLVHEGISLDEGRGFGGAQKLPQ